MSNHRQDPQIRKHKLSCEAERNFYSYTTWDRWGNSGWIYFGGLQITADGECSHEIKRGLLLGRKVMINLVQFSLIAQSCLTLCDPINHSPPGLPVHQQFPEFTQTHAHRVGDAIQPSHLLSSPFSSCPQPLPASGSFPTSLHFAWGGQVLEFQLQHQSFQWTPRTDLF